MNATDLRYSELLSRTFPTAAAASAEIINLNAVLNLPKGTEFFASDIHGEYEAFSHILRNASGSIRLKIEEVFGAEPYRTGKAHPCHADLLPVRKNAGSSCPSKKMPTSGTPPRCCAWLRCAAAPPANTPVRACARRCRKTSPTSSKSLMTEQGESEDKQGYYDAIIEAVIRTGRAGALIEALCRLIQRLAIDRLHIVGDIYDRGPAPHIIMDTLMEHHAIDIQWGNHDIVWMGASLGQRGCIAHVVRNCARYGNLSILEDAYGINILPLAAFALEAYKDDPCVAFGLKGNPQLTPQELEMNIKIQKAMAIIQFKVEGALIDENPAFNLQDRKPS